MSDGVTVQGLDTMLRLVERELTRAPFTILQREGSASATTLSQSLYLSDQLTPAAAVEAENLRPFSVFVSVPSSDNTEGFRGRSAVEVAEAVVVTLAYKVRPANQRASRDEAIRLEESVRERVMDLGGPLRVYRPSYVGARRGPSETIKEWWISTQTFSFLRAAGVDE